MIPSTVETTTLVKHAKRRLSFDRFIDWCNKQENYRFGWVAGIITLHGCVLTPITVFTIFMAGNNLFFLILALVAMAMSLIANLAAMPTKVTIPIFFISVLIDLGIVIANLATLAMR